MKVLVVDDSGTMRRIIIRALEKCGSFQCIEAADGKEALEQLKKEGADLIVTDWNMPNLSGVDFAQAVRLEMGLKTPILMVTTNATHGDVVEALKCGVNNYLVKPFTPEALKEKVDAILK